MFFIMKILVCIKQVPASSQVTVDTETGVLQRSGHAAKLNPYDEYALETALQIKAHIGGSVTAITMGAAFSADILREAYGFGVDGTILLTDYAFAGADVLATSFALSQAIQAAGPFDLIICGRQTTDGDTAQVGPALAEWLGIPHVSWVSKIVDVDSNKMVVEQDMGHLVADTTMPYPCLITVEKDIFRPRLPSYITLKRTRDYPIKTLTLADLPCTNPGRYGLLGSPTQVERTFPPEAGLPAEALTGTSQEVAGLIYKKIGKLKLLSTKTTLGESAID